MISSQKLWAGRGSGSSLAGEKSAWQPLPTGWLGQESREARGSGRAAGDSCPCISPLHSMLAALFPGELKHNRCAEYAWFSSGKVTSISFLERRAVLLQLGESCPSCPMRAWGVSSLPVVEGHTHTLLHQSLLVAACLGFPKCSALQLPKGNPCGFLGFGGSAPTQGFRRGAQAERGELCCGYCISASRTLDTSCARGCCFGVVTACPAEAADATLTCRHPPMLGAAVWLSGASPCSRAVLSCKHPWPGQFIPHGAAQPAGHRALCPAVCAPRHLPHLS